MNTDQQQPIQQPWHRSLRMRLVLAAVCLGSLTLLYLALAPKLPGLPEVADSPVESRVKVVSGSIKPGESVTSLLGNLLNAQQLHELTVQSRKVFPLRQIAVGQPYKLSLTDNAFEKFEYDISSEEQLIISRVTDGFSVVRSPINYTVKPIVVQGTITASLFQAVVATGESEGLAMQLADIFAWDIDFFHDIQVGDSFRAVVEKRYRDGAPAGNGRVLAADFTVQGETSTAFYFKDGEKTAGYYDKEGRSLRKAFLKAPLSFSRISSGFTMRRRHPVTNQVKPHPAIDYAAPSGTPIHTVGNGTVTAAAYNRYNGKYVKVQHPDGWVTMYNHLSRFGKNIKRGTKVQQGQRIGYVGSTGLSTGPHLDFRMYKRGTPVNPLKVKSPPARPVSRAQMAAFREVVEDRMAFLQNNLAQGHIVVTPASAGQGT